MRRRRLLWFLVPVGVLAGFAALQVCTAPQPTSFAFLKGRDPVQEEITPHVEMHVYQFKEVFSKDEVEALSKQIERDMGPPMMSPLGFRYWISPSGLVNICMGPMGTIPGVAPPPGATKPSDQGTFVRVLVDLDRASIWEKIGRALRRP